MSKREWIRSHYEPRLQQHGENYLILDWASRRSQVRRFQVLTESVELEGRSLLDVGCGLGDLWAYLKRRKVHADYTGVDIIAGMLDRARAYCPDGRFIQADVFDEPCPLQETFEVVFCSGMLNLNLGNNLAFLPRAIERFFDLSSRHVVFNLLHIRSAVETHRYHFYDPAFAERVVRRFTDKVTIRDDYLPNDFTVIAEKP